MKDLARAVTLQKIAELFVLSLLLAAVIFVGSRGKDPDSWGLYNLREASLWASLRGGIAVSLTFFLFTLYPLMTGILVIVLEKSFHLRPLGLALSSALVSIVYFAIWCLVTGFDLDLIPYGAVAIVMFLFILVSSRALYKPRSVSSGSSGQ